MSGEQYARAALRSEAERVRAAVEGTRNDTLNTAAFRLGQLVGDGVLSAHEADEELVSAAVSTGLGVNEARATVRSGMRGGAARPRAGGAGGEPALPAGRGVMTYAERIEALRRRRADEAGAAGQTEEATTPAEEPPAPAGGPLGDDFWDARPYLKHIRAAAHSRQRSATAVLGVVLARVAACVPHRLRIPPIVGSDAGLSLITVVLAPPGVGKSTASALAGQLVPAPDGLDLADELPIGSGEGMAEAFFGVEDEQDERGRTRKVKRQVRHNAYFYADEGQVLGELGRRQNAVLLPTIRSAFSGTALGQMNASEERRRVVPAGAYTLGIVAAMQTVLAGALLDDAEGGTPQRCLWVPAIDSTIPDEAPPWPGRLDWQPPSREAMAARRADGWLIGEQTYLAIAEPVAGEIRAADLARVRGEVATDALDAHEGLLRLKVAALLAVLDGRLDVGEEDWRLASAVKAASDRARAGVVRAVSERAAAEELTRSARVVDRAVSSAVEADTAVARRRMVDGARWIARKVWAEPDQWSPSGLRRAMDSRKRDVFTDALDHAMAEGWVTIATEPGHGTDKRTVQPGTQRPP